MYREAALKELIGARADRRETAIALACGPTNGMARWDERASVRRTPRRVLTSAGAEAVFFPPELYPVVDHPLVSELGPDIRRQLLIQRLYDYLDFTTELEALAVIPVAIKISRNRAGLLIPDQARADAFKIVTDEAWHAQFSHDFIRQVERQTGTRHLNAGGLAAFVDHLDRIHEALPWQLRGIEELLFAVVSETLISSILSDLPQDTRLPDSVRELVRDHAEDEGRHHVYFRSILRHLWPALSASEQAAVGPFLPEIIYAFLEPDYTRAARNLLAAGVRKSQVDQVVRESWPRSRVNSEVAAAASTAVRYFAEVGALDAPCTREAFQAAGLVEGMEG